jgi:hypothetical protein
VLGAGCPRAATIFTAGDCAELFLPLLLGGLVGIALGLVPVLARADLTTTRLFFLGQRFAAEGPRPAPPESDAHTARPRAPGSPDPRTLVVSAPSAAAC